MNNKNIHYINYDGKLALVNNALYDIENSEVDDIYRICINNKLFNRLVKLEKVTGNKNNIISYIRKLFENEISFYDYLQESLADELARKIKK